MTAERPFRRLIDPPSSFCSIEEWRRFRAAMADGLARNPGDPDYAAHLVMADEHIAGAA